MQQCKLTHWRGNYTRDDLSLWTLMAHSQARSLSLSHTHSHTLKMAEESACYWRLLWSSTRSWVQKKTADVLQDYPPPKVPDEPSVRTMARFIVTALALAGALITICFVYTGSEGSRTVRHWGSAYLLTLPTSQQNYPNLLCPCNKPSIPWPYFLNFYWINQTAGGHTTSWNRYPITNYTQFCDSLTVVVGNVSSGTWLQGCYLMGQSLLSYTNQTMRTTVSTNTVTSPSVLAHIITVDMQDNVENVFADYAYLSTNYFAEWVQLLIVKQMFSRAAYRFVISTNFMKDKNATNDVYWRFFAGDCYSSPPPAGAKIKAFDLTGNRALVLEMNWTVYVHQCNPPYCDQVVKRSLLRRFVSAMIEVGGFAAAMMVVLRGVVWPCICYLNQWP